jgi:2-C-methyl-D-erythritol 4-phosphate cytidylyltransferase
MATFGVIVFTAAPDAVSSPQGALVKIDGREALLRSVELFVNRDEITQIVVGFNPADAEAAKSKFGSHLMILGFKAATGGPGLREQLKACAEKLPDDVTHVILHDAARPAVSANDIDKLIELAPKHPALAMVTPLASPLVRIDEAGVLSESLAPKPLRHLVWPQVLQRKLFDEALAKGFEAVLSRLHPMESSPYNVRVNGANEAAYLKAMIALLPKPKTKASSNPFDEAQW